VLYTVELADVAAEIGINIHMYADDTSIHCKQSDTTDAVAKLERCISVVDKWMAASRLKMNSDKSEVIWLGSKRTLSTHALCVLISADLKFDQHVRTVSGQCYQLWIQNR